MKLLKIVLNNVYVEANSMPFHVKNLEYGIWSKWTTNLMTYD